MAQRLERENVVHLEKQLWQWQTPETMDQVVGAVESATFFNQSGLAFLRDASVAAEFGKARGAEKVRLVSDRWPDFELVIDGRIEQFEAVEADKPGRRRGKEYRDATTVVVDDPVEEWIACAEQAPAWITAACEKKKAQALHRGRKTSGLSEPQRVRHPAKGGRVVLCGGHRANQR